jgi:hypothetical protein
VSSGQWPVLGEIAKYPNQVGMGVQLPRSQDVIIPVSRRARLSAQVTEHHGILRQIWQLQ